MEAYSQRARKWNVWQKGTCTHTGACSHNRILCSKSQGQTRHAPLHRWTSGLRHVAEANAEQDALCDSMDIKFTSSKVTGLAVKTVVSWGRGCGPRRRMRAPPGGAGKSCMSQGHTHAVAHQAAHFTEQHLIIFKLCLR